MLIYFRSIVFWALLAVDICLLTLILPVVSLLFRNQTLNGRLVAWLARLLLFFSLVRLEVKGREHLKELPRRAGLIIAANHASFLDYFVLQAGLGLPLNFLVWRAGFKLPLLRQIYASLGYVAVGQDKLVLGRGIYESLDKGDKLVVLSRPSFNSETEIEFGESLPGISTARRAPILPVAIKNASGVLPLGKFIFKGSNVVVVVGKPAYYSSARELYEGLIGLYTGG